MFYVSNVSVAAFLILQNLIAAFSILNFDAMKKLASLKQLCNLNTSIKLIKIIISFK
jgi:hypothetical protein